MKTVIQTKYCRAALLTMLVMTFTLALSSCWGGSPEETVEQMRQAACRGDVEGFMSHIDKDALIRNQRKMSVTRVMDEKNKESTLGEKLVRFVIGQLYIHGINPFQDETDSFESLDARYLQLFERDIGHGESSGFCNFSISNVNRRSGEVKIRFSGTDIDQTLYFGNSFGEWKLEHLVFENNNEDTTADADLPPSDRDAQSSNKSAKSGIEETGRRANAVDSPGYDFRKTRWGMTPGEIKASESLNPKLEGETSSGSYLISYEGSAGGLDAVYLYRLTGGRLTEGAYYFNQERSNPTAYFEDYKKLKEKLTAKYGAPAADKIIRGDEFYKGRPEDALSSLVSGDANYSAAWVTRSTIITLHLYNDDGKLKLALLYTPNDGTELPEKDESDETNEF